MGDNGTGEVDNGTPDHTDTVKAWTRLLVWPAGAEAIDVYGNVI